MESNNICICSVQTLFVKGGAELLTNILALELRKRDFSVEIINFPLLNSPRKNILKSALSWRMIDLNAYTEHPIDLVITTKFPSYAIQHQNKITWLFHQLREAYDLFNTEYYFFHNNKVDQEIRDMIITIDNATLPESKAVYTISKNVSNRLKQYNNVDSNVLYPPPQRNLEFKNKPPENYILTIGRLVPTKRIDLLVRAMAFTPDNIKAIVVGEGQYRPILEQIVEKLGLEDKINFISYVSDKELIDLYSRAFAVFYAPFDEDYGFVTVEAFNSAKPVISCYDSGGPLEFVKHEETGILCNPNPPEIGEAINQLFSNTNRSIEMGQLGKEYVKNITWDRVIETLTSHL